MARSGTTHRDDAPRADVSGRLRREVIVRNDSSMVRWVGAERQIIATHTDRPVSESTKHSA